MRSAFARFWSMRVSTTLQIGNAQVADQFFRAQAQHGQQHAPTVPALPADLAEWVADLADEAD